MTSLALPVGASFTVDDVEAFPDGGFRYELYDGLLVVTPAPDHAHQTAVLELAVILRAALAGSPLKVLVAPFEWRIGRRTEFQPDLIVAPRSVLPANPARLEQPPALAVEVLSPSTRAHDLGAKRVAYAAASLQHYWIVDADPDAPSITVLELDVARGEYVEAASAVGDESISVERPFAVTASPASLVD